MFHVIDRITYEKLVEGFTQFGCNYAKASAHAGVDYRMAKRAYHGGKRPLGPDMPPIEQLLRDREEAAMRSKVEQEAAQEAERSRVAAEAEKARALVVEAETIDATSLRALRKTTLAGLAACTQLTDGITKLATRIGNQLATGVDANGKVLNIDVDKALRTMRDYSGTVAKLSMVVDTIQAMERVKQNLPTAIVGLDVAHVTLEDAEREVEFAAGALKRAKELGLVVVAGGAGKTGT